MKFLRSSWKQLFKALIPFFVSITILLIFIVNRDSIFSSLLNVVCFNIEVIIAIIIITSHMFVILNTLFFILNINADSELLTDEFGHLRKYKTIAVVLTWFSIICSVTYSGFLLIFSWFGIGQQNKFKFSEIINYNDWVAFLIFLLFFFIDLFIYIFLKKISKLKSQGKIKIKISGANLKNKIDYSMGSMMMIDLPTVIGITMVIFLSSFLEKPFYKEITQIGLAIFPNVTQIKEEINHLVIMSISSGAIAMQIIFSQIIFIILDIKNVWLDFKDGKSSSKAQPDKKLDSKKISPES